MIQPSVYLADRPDNENLIASSGIINSENVTCVNNFCVVIDVSMENSAYVYSLTDPTRDDEPFYVGKGQKSRARAHLSGSNFENYRKIERISDIRSKGLNPGVRIEMRGLSDADALDEEKKLIASLGRIGIDPGGILTNILPGGKGIPSGESHPAFGCKHSENAIARRVENSRGKTANYGSKNGIFGTSRPKHVIDAVRASRLGSVESKDKLKIRSEAIKRSYVIKNNDIYQKVFYFHDLGMPKKYIASELECSHDLVTKAIKDRSYIESVIESNKVAKQE